MVWDWNWNFDEHDNFEIGYTIHVIGVVIENELLK